MNVGRTVFAQVMEFLPLREFRACVARYEGQARGQSFSCLDQFLTLAFAQLTARDSLRDIVTCLNAMTPKLYHMGFRGAIRRSTLADANEQRDWRIYADFAQRLIAVARPLYASDDLGLELDATVYALDATLIDLCLSLFPWARFRPTVGLAAVKLHTLLDLRGTIPTVIHITPGRVHETVILDALALEPGAIYIMDRGYLDFTRFRRLSEAGAFFVTRAKRDTQLARVYSQPVAPAERTAGVRSDHTVRLTGRKGGAYYPMHLRRVRFYDADQARTLTFLTNAFDPPAATIAALYKRRWQIELFFKWIKQHLHIKRFYGTSENAVKTQIWTAVSVYVLVAILRKRLRCELSLYTVLQILSVSLFEKVALPQLLTTFDPRTLEEHAAKQLQLFDL
jgi:transposase